MTARMTPIHDLLARVRWDADFGRARFEIAYLDRVAHRLVRLPLEHIVRSPQDRFALEAIEDDGSVHRVPLHRIREVWRNGQLIWSRTGH